MKENRYRIELDTIDVKKNDYIEIVAGDYLTHILDFRLTQKGEPYSLSGVIVEIDFLKPDRKLNRQDINTGVIIVNEENGEVSCILSPNSINIEGMTRGEIKISRGEKLLTFTRFEFFVRNPLLTDNIVESTTELPILKQLIGRVDKLIFEQIEMIQAELEREVNEEKRQILYLDMVNLRDRIIGLINHLGQMNEDIILAETIREASESNRKQNEILREELRLKLEVLGVSLEGLKDDTINIIDLANRAIQDANDKANLANEAATDARLATKDIKELEILVSESEATRAVSESERALAEIGRVEAEQNRELNYVEKINEFIAETERVEAEYPVRLTSIEQDLTQHKEDYTTQRQQDQLKVATVEKEVQDYKSTIASVNVNQEARQKASGYGIISLPRNSANGQVSAGLKANTYTNELGVKGKGDSLAGWSQTDAITLNNGYFEIDTTSVVRGRIPFKIIGGRKYFVAAIGNSFNANTGFDLCVALAKGFTTSTSTTVSNLLVLFNPNDSYISKKSTFLTATSDGDVLVLFRNTLAGDSLAKYRVHKILVVDLTAMGLESLTKNECEQRFNYVDNTKSTVSTSRLKSVGKNMDLGLEVGLLDVSTGLASSSNLWMRSKTFNRVNNKKTYRITTHPDYRIRNYFLYDINGKFISQTLAPNNSYTETLLPNNIGENTAFIKYVIRRLDSATLTLVDIVSIQNNTQLEESTIITPYEPYKESNQYLPNVGELRSLPNGTKDEIRVVGNKAELVKRVSGEILINNNSPIINLASVGESIYRVELVNFATVNNAIVNITNTIKATLGNIELKQSHSSNESEGIWIHSNNSLYIKILKTKISTMPSGSTLQGFKEYFNANPITLNYQLAEPIITPIQTSGNLISYPSGTVYVENVVADAGNYTTKFDIKELQLPIKSIDKLIKYNFTTGVQTVLDTSLAVINADKKSFTHPNLTNKDMVFVDYYYDVEGTLGETTIEYYDSRHTIKDSINNKFYSWNIKSSNGVPTVNLTEVL